MGNRKNAFTYLNTNEIAQIKFKRLKTNHRILNKWNIQYEVTLTDCAPTSLTHAKLKIAIKMSVKRDLNLICKLYSLVYRKDSSYCVVQIC